MGMGYGSNYADTVSQDFVEKTCPLEYQKLMDAIDKYDEYDSIADLAQEINICNSFEDFPLIDAALTNLENSFEEKVGLPLGLAYHDPSESGDRYDEVDGEYWYVDNVYTMTPEAKKIEEEVTRKHFVTFG